MKCTATERTASSIVNSFLRLNPDGYYIFLYGSVVDARFTIQSLGAR